MPSLVKVRLGKLHGKTFPVFRHYALTGGTGVGARSRQLGRVGIGRGGNGFLFFGKELEVEVAERGVGTRGAFFAGTGGRGGSCFG